MVAMQRSHEVALKKTLSLNMEDRIEVQNHCLVVST